MGFTIILINKTDNIMKKLIINFTMSDIQELEHLVTETEEGENIEVFEWSFNTECGEPIDVRITVGNDDY